MNEEDSKEQEIDWKKVVIINKRVMMKKKSGNNEPNGEKV